MSHKIMVVVRGYQVGLGSALFPVLVETVFPPESVYETGLHLSAATSWAKICSLNGPYDLFDERDSITKKTFDALVLSNCQTDMIDLDGHIVSRGDKLFRF